MSALNLAKFSSIDELIAWLDTQFVVALEEEMGWRQWLWLPPFSEEKALLDYWTNLGPISVSGSPDTLLPGKFLCLDTLPAGLKSDTDNIDVFDLIYAKYSSLLKTTPYVVFDSGCDAYMMITKGERHYSAGFRMLEDLSEIEFRISHKLSPIIIISGGQTGVERGALDAALGAGYEIAGWCPADGRAEDGLLDKKYNLQKHQSHGYRGRTVANVRDSHATVIIYWAEPKAGTRETLKICLRKNIPFKLVDASLVSSAQAAESIKKFILKHQATRVNFAGPSASKVPEAYEYSYQTVSLLIRLLNECKRLTPKSPRLLFENHN